MMNETSTFNMPSLLAEGSDEMLKRAKADTLVVALKGYRIHILGASLSGLSPQAWSTVKSFWAMYFHESGAEFVEYSPEPSFGRN
jgi:hypothetical protein